MNTLSPQLRKKLERTVIEARDVAEAGARVALEALAVQHHEPYGHMDTAQRTLRRRLRAHARQLGDRLNSPLPSGEGPGVRVGAHGIDHLVHECAYEHWHGMLFARFLAENHLLIEPEMGIAISLDECEDLAREVAPARPAPPTLVRPCTSQGIDKWQLAACFAHHMLPQVFRPDHPVFEVQFAREHRLKLEGLVEELPSEIFAATDALGWVYQFWQTKKKEEVNRSEVKIGADELPAVTQLFTEPYMVQFLLHNSLGAWWVSKQVTGAGFRVSGQEDLATLEDRLRDQYSPPGQRLDFLRFVERPADTRHPTPDTDTRLLTPAAGTFADWPNHLSKFRLLDPCCGSGHFLVAAFLMLVPMRMALEGLSATEAVDSVLRENLHGLELDQRCVAIAAFALALEAWRYPNTGGYRPLPNLNLAWCGQPAAGKREQWLALAEGDERLEAGMAMLYDTFREAPILGSLIDPTRAVPEDLLTAGFAELEPLLERALRAHAGDEEWAETAIAARGLADAARLLGDHYHLVITNVPYLTRGKQSERLRKFSETHYPQAKNDLANVFLERCLELVTGDGCQVSEGTRSKLSPDTEHPSPEQTPGTVQIVMPQNWLFLTSYKKQRGHLLKEVRWELLARLGAGAFDTISGEVVNVILLTLSQVRPKLEDPLHGIDASAPRTATGKAEVLRNGEVVAVSQQGQLGNPDAIISLNSAEIAGTLIDIAYSFHGLTTGDMPRMKFCFWEVTVKEEIWVQFQSTTKSVAFYSGLESYLRWNGGRGAIDELLGARKDGQGAWGKKGVTVSQMRGLPVALYAGNPFDNNTATLIPNREEYLGALWAFCSSGYFLGLIRSFNQKLNVDSGYFNKVPFDLDHWTKVAEERYPNGLPKPYSNDPTQWIFHGHPCGSVVWNEAKKWTTHGPLRTDATVLQVAVARLLGYRWPAENDPDMELADEQREWVVRVSGLGCQVSEQVSGVRCQVSGEAASNPIPDTCHLLPDQTPATRHPSPHPRHPPPLIDEDGIVCIPSVRGERPAHERLLYLLEAAWGEDWNDGILAKLLAEASSNNLEDWLRNQFFQQHCKLFHHRPFIWHIWDGRKRDGFHALVNYHKLAEGSGRGRRLLESLTYSYLGDWIARQQDGVKRGEGGAEDRLAAAVELQKRLVAVLEGKPPFDLFVRWKPSEEQPIGWEPDINDGVRLNIRPFMAQDIPGGKKGAGILRAKPNIKWSKDRGKEPMREQEQFPWFWNDGKFTGERVNEIHLTNAEKKTARERAEGKQ